MKHFGIREERKLKLSITQMNDVNILRMKLEQCPFCGESYAINVLDASDQYVSSFWVTCGNCDAEGPVADTEDDAVEKWNKRISELK